MVNDTCGHAAGDEMLRQVARLMQRHVRRGDLLARLGGDEFGLLLYRCALEDALAVARQVLTHLEAIGVDFAQGYHIGRPRPLAELAGA